MGGVWCKADKGQTRSYGSKVPFNSTISRWTENVRQAYRKPKTHHRPPRPPQKPLRSNDRLTISHPQLVTDASSDGWRTATLLVPEPAPVPPPRKKRKRSQDISRTAFSMNDLTKVESFNQSTISLPDKYHLETGLESRSSSSTLVVTPVLESRLDHSTDEVDSKLENNKENIRVNIENKIEEEDEEDIEVNSISDEIIPIEKETLFSTRTLLHSNLGYIDKLSAISEVSTESGFDDRTDIGKSSEQSGSVTSSESGPRDTGLNILAHIQNINNVSNLNEANKDIREKTAISKKEFLQNILKEESDPYFIARDSSADQRLGSDGLILGGETVDIPGQLNSLPADHLHLMNRETETSVADNSANKTPPPSPTSPAPIYDTVDTNHSVLLELLQKNHNPEAKSDTSNPFLHKEESIFLTNTKTNIIYKSLSSDNLTDDYNIDYPITSGADQSIPDSCLNNLKGDVLKSTSEEKNSSLGSTNPFKDLTSESQLSDYTFKTPKLVESDDGLNTILDDKRSNVVSSFDFKELNKAQNYVLAMEDLQLSSDKSSDVRSTIVANGIDHHPGSPISEKKPNDSDVNNKMNAKESLAKNDSFSSSRRSSMSDSLHEFEMSIYDMLNESKKSRDSSDEEDSLKTVKAEKRH